MANQTETFRGTIQNTGEFAYSCLREWRKKNDVIPTSFGADTTRQSLLSELYNER
jgi:hypothetical protein